MQHAQTNTDLHSIVVPVVLNFNAVSYSRSSLAIGNNNRNDEANDHFDHSVYEPIQPHREGRR